MLEKYLDLKSSVIYINVEFEKEKIQSNFHGAIKSMQT